MTTPKLSMPQIAVGQAGKEITHNEALKILDALVQGTVISRSLAGPPGSPADGDMYIVGDAATGDWEGQEDKLALWRTDTNAWTFITARDGWVVWVDADSAAYRFLSGAWVDANNPIDTQYRSLILAGL